MMAERDPDGDVIDQADALMRRYRSFVARPATQPLTTEGNRDDGDEEEIPLLTEIVTDEALGPGDIPALLDAIRDELDAALSAWLVEVLPAAVANASQQILAELDGKTRSTLLPRLREIVEVHLPPRERD